VSFGFCRAYRLALRLLHQGNSGLSPELPWFFFQIVMLTSSAAGLKSLPSWRAAGLIKKNDFLYRVLLATKKAKSYGKKNGLRINICKGLIPEPGHQCQPDWSNSLRP
jgi:hypothetical protein